MPECGAGVKVVRGRRGAVGLQSAGVHSFYLRLLLTLKRVAEQVFGFGNKGRELANRVADHVGVERNLFDSALLEFGFGWAHWKPLVGSALPIETVANDVRPKVVEGLRSLRRKFGDQDEIVAALNRLEYDDVNTDVAASEASKLKMTVDQHAKRESTIEDMRHQSFSDWVDSLGPPAGMDGARILAGLWATVADRGCSVEQISQHVNMPIARADRAVQTLYEAGGMARGVGYDGIMYYSLGEGGMRVGQQIARQWLAITQLYRH